MEVVLGALMAVATASPPFLAPGYHGYGYAGPVVKHAIHAVPVVKSVHAVYAPRHQHHSQDAWGNYNYGYADINSAKEESKIGNTVVGSYSHINADGTVTKNDYVADEFGFRSSLAPTAAKDFAPKVTVAYGHGAPYTHAAPLAYKAGFAYGDPWAVPAYKSFKYGFHY
ncbi:unnamed protein product [Darwinula stevensoni]|uniref:Cuticle protein 7 n=1 Tax=Darwinula stevensoni TaxID=69355 RepID=A0A7R8X6T4_9CRUS|nr:unnamed protein product [Darwinula stevensoni]CAG0887204.1 unnamed protein product [Darwinula stevensoni]